MNRSNTRECSRHTPRPSIRLSYVICATPRSGSNLLCEVLQDTGVAGRPDEYFWNPPPGHERWTLAELRAYLDRILTAGTTPNGVFGIKLMWSYLGDWLPRLAALTGREGASPSDLLAITFPNLHYVWLTRRDKVRQGISFYRAAKTSRWRSTDPGDTSASEPAFDFKAIDHLVGLSIADDLAWHHFFQQHTIEPLTLVYEELEHAPDEAADRVLHHLGLTASERRPSRAWRHQRQADDLTDEWVRQYHLMKGSVT